MRSATPSFDRPRVRGAVARLALWATLGALGAGADVAAAQALDRVQERRVKAAFLVRFLEYVEWPERAFASPEAPFVMAVVDAPDIVAELAPIVAVRRVGDRAIVLRAVPAGEPVRDAHVVFVDASSRAPLRAVANDAQSRGAMSVAETEGALHSGVVINFLRHDGRVRFEVSLGAAQRGGLRLSSRLLAVAHRVVSGVE